MITNAERSQIRQILQAPQWRTVERVIEDFIIQLQSDSSVKDTEWETLRETLIKEGRVQGMRLVISKLYEEAKEEI